MGRKILPPAGFFLAGAVLGVVSKLLDLYTTNLGNMFSELSVWILLGVVIARSCRTRREACRNVFFFCIGMLSAYYLTAEFTAGTYSMTFVLGWTVFSLFSPVFACLAWMTKEKGTVSVILSIGILLVTLLASVIVFDGPRLYDYVILLILACLFFARGHRRQN